MNVREAVATRRAIRAFAPHPVPYDVLRSVLDDARKAPSGCNYQPWEAIVLTGEPLRRIQQAMMASERQDPMEYAWHPPGIPAEYKVRQEEAMRPVYGAVGINRDDVSARAGFQARNLTGFGAPVLLLCFLPRVMGPPQWGDAGMWLQTIMLLLRERGLDSCAQGYVSFYARLIKQLTGVSDETHILYCGLAIGYRDDEAAINTVEISRVPLEHNVQFRGFDGAA